MWQFFLLLSVVGCRCLVWNNLKVMEESFQYFKDAGDAVMTSVDSKLEVINAELEQFIANIDKDKMILSIKSLPEVDSCPENNFNLETLRKSFRIQVIQLEQLVSARARKLQEKYTEIEASLTTYKSLADGRWWACKFRGSDCTQDVETWLSSELASLSCQITPDCLGRKLYKRSPQWNVYGLPNDEHIAEVDEDSPCQSYEVSCPGDLCLNRESYLRGEIFCPLTITPAPVPVCQGKFDCFQEFGREPGLFSGVNDRCIDLTKVCDGNFDCSNGIDESRCTSNFKAEARSCNLDSGEFLCDNKECIGLSRVCDGTDSCGDGSDEGGRCGVGSCDEVCNEGVCFRGPRGPMCLSQCPPGTFETPSGCLTGRAHANSTLSELLGDMPRLMKRQIGAYYRLRSKATEAIAKYLDEAARCRGGYFLSIGSVYKLNALKKHKSLKVTSEASATTTD